MLPPLRTGQWADALDAPPSPYLGSLAPRGTRPMAILYTVRFVNSVGLELGVADSLAVGVGVPRTVICVRTVSGPGG